MIQHRRWHLYDDAEALRERAAAAILRIAIESIAARGEFHLVLAGGETPRAIYSRLARARADWTRWRVYFGDERVAPRDDSARNSTMAYSAWLSRQAAVQVHPIPTELGGRRAASEYADVVGSLRFDLVLLGLGEDGHTASLFDMNVENPDADVVVTNNAPKPPLQRVSLTARCLSRSHQVLFLITGAAKRDAVARWYAGEALPAAAITPPAGVDILIEQAAYP